MLRYRYRMHWEHERYCGLSRDALVIGRIRNTNVIVVRAWMLRYRYRMHWEHERYCGLSMDAPLPLPDALGTRTLLWFEQGCSGYRTHSEHERYCGLSMDALVIGRIRNTNVIVVRAWMLWLSDALGTVKILWLAQECFCFLLYTLGTRTLVWFEHGCSVTVTGGTGNTYVIVVWA